MLDLMQILRPSLFATSPCHAQVCPFLTGLRQRTLSCEVATNSQLKIMARTPAFWSMMVAVAPPCWMLGCPQSCSLGEKMQQALVILFQSISDCRKQVLQKQKPASFSRRPQSRKDLLIWLQPFMMLCLRSLPRRWWWRQEETMACSSAGRPVAGTTFRKFYIPRQVSPPPSRHPTKNRFINQSTIPIKKRRRTLLPGCFII